MMRCKFLPLALLGTALSAVVACTQEASPPGPSGPFVLDESALQTPRSFPAYYLEHKRYFDEHVTRVGNAPVWLLRNPGNWAANSIVIEGDSGFIVFDTGVNREQGAIIREAIARISDKPVQALIYSHHHADHVSGADQLVTAAAAAAGEVDIIAWHNFMREYTDENLVVGPIMGLRAMYMFGAALPAEDNVHQGCCGRQFIGGISGFLPPNRLLDHEQTLTVAGVELQFFYTGGEAATEIGVYLPAYDIALVGDELYPALANLYTIRGAKFRDAQKWAHAAQRVLDFDPEYLLGSHLPDPIAGREAIANALDKHADAILYLHDQAVRYILRGETPAMLQARFQALPDFLDTDPYTRPMYGTAQYNTAQQFIGYLGIHEGDAVQFRRKSPAEQAARLLPLMGGRDEVLWQAQRALADDAQWAAELATLVIRVDADDNEARALKAAAFRRLGYAEVNPQWRNWYLTAAGELDGSIDPVDLQARLLSVAATRDLPLTVFFDNMRFRVNAEELGSRELTVAVRLTDTGAAHLLRLRNAVLHRDDTPSPQALGQADATLSISTGLMREVLLGKADLRKEILLKNAAYEGDRGALRDFFASFDAGITPVYMHLQ